MQQYTAQWAPETPKVPPTASLISGMAVEICSRTSASCRFVSRDWKLSKSWLARELSRSEHNES